MLAPCWREWRRWVAMPCRLHAGRHLSCGGRAGALPRGAGRAAHIVLANLGALLGAALQLDGGQFLTPYALVRALRQW